jgi:hypothetical protein
VDTVEKGMLYLTFVHPIGWQIIKIDKAPQDSKLYILDNGYPVKPWIVDIGDPNIPEEEILATPDQIGWMDEGDHMDELMDIEVRHMNRILDRYMGWIFVEVDEDGEPILFMDKVTILYADDIDDEWDDDDFSEWQSLDDGWDDAYWDNGPDYDSAGYTEEDR